MKLSELHTLIGEVLKSKGDTDNVALCLVMGGKKPYRRDAFGEIEVIHDTGEYLNGMTYLVAEFKLKPVLKKRPRNNAEVMQPRISHPKPCVTSHRCV